VSKSSSSHAIGSHARDRPFAALEKQVTPDKEGLAVVVPGLGSEEHAALVEKNLQWLKHQDVPYDCFLFVYKSEEEFPLETSRFEPCKVIRHPGMWLSHLLVMPLNMTTKPYVLHMMAGVEPQPDVNLKLIFKTMETNGLGHAAPTFDPRTNEGDYVNNVYPILGRQENVRVGRFVDFIELHFNVFTRRYFACLQDNIDASEENMLIGWGMDRLLPALCGGAAGGSEVEAGRIGLMDQMTMVKRLHGSYDFGAAQQGFESFVGRHPDTAGPTFSTLGELEEPLQA
jgi:hypothetical protein